MKHTEYIVPIGEEALDVDEMFIGVIRRQPELIRCKDCKHYYVLNEFRGNCSEYNFVEKIPIDYCSWAERRNDERME